MAEEFEKLVCQHCRLLIEKIEYGIDIDEDSNTADLLKLLETIVSRELRKKYSDWKYESLDGIYSGHITMTDLHQINIIGMCILTSDQTLVPIYINIKLSDKRDEVVWINCNLAESSNAGIIRIPYSSNKWRKLLYALNKDQINWFYSFAYRTEDVKD